jgi:UDP-N-acetylglucosamine:LPS N-acetylglucosamine transferase
VSIAIISAQTGNGHNAVMSTLEEGFKNKGYHDVSVYPSFYEDLSISHKVLSDFYNFLLTASTEMCAKFVEFSALKGPGFWEMEYSECYDKIVDFVETEGLEAIVSTTPLINKPIIRILEEKGLEIPYYIVLTDPFKPVASGFAEKGTTRFFCPTNIVKNILEKCSIEPSLIEVTGYPIAKKFTREFSASEKESIYEKMGLSSDKKTLLLNSGAYGIPHYKKFLEAAVNSKHDVQIILICGRNKFLFKQANRYVEKNQLETVKVFPFIDNVWEVLQIADLTVTKSGANTFFECLHAKTIPIIDGVTGFLYQERGVIDYLSEFKVGMILNNHDELHDLLDECFTGDVLTEYSNNIEAMKLVNGTDTIVTRIMENL